MRDAVAIRTARTAPPAATSLRLVLGLELRRALARRRLLALNVAIPLLLVTPIALGAAPSQHATAVYAVLFALFGTFGAAIPLLRDTERGWLSRLSRTALDARGHVIGHALAGAVLDLAQLAPSLIGIAATTSGWAALPALGIAAAGALVFANVLGTWVAAAARSVAEGALFAAVSCLLLLHASGVFRTPAPGSAGATLERVAPFRPLHEALVAGQSGAPSVDVAASGAIVLAALALTGALATPLRRRLARAGRTG